MQGGCGVPGRELFYRSGEVLQRNEDGLEMVERGGREELRGTWALSLHQEAEFQKGQTTVLHKIHATSWIINHWAK